MHAASAGHKICTIVRFFFLLLAGAFTVMFLENWSETNFHQKRFYDKILQQKDLETKTLKSTLDQISKKVAADTTNNLNNIGPQIIQGPGNINHFHNLVPIQNNLGEVISTTTVGTTTTEIGSELGAGFWGKLLGFFFVYCKVAAELILVRL